MKRKQGETDLPVGHVKALPFPRSEYTMGVDMAILISGGTAGRRRLPGAYHSERHGFKCRYCTFLKRCRKHSDRGYTTDDRGS